MNRATANLILAGPKDWLMITGVDFTLLFSHS